MTSRLHPGFWLLTFALTVPVFAGETPATDITREPPATGITSESPAPDPRLLQKVSLSVHSVPLHRAMEELAKKTGVMIRAGAGNTDWRVRERKVHLLFRDVPLKTVLDETARTLGYALRRGGKEGAWTYAIYQTDRGRQEEATQVAAQKEESERRARAVREATLSDADKALALTPEDAARLKGTNPWLAYLGGAERGRAFAALLHGLPASARDRIRQGKKAVIDLSALDPALRERALAALDDREAEPDIDPTEDPEVAEIERRIWERMRRYAPARVAFVPSDPVTAGEEPTETGSVGTLYLLGDPADPSAPDLEGPAGYGTALGSMSMLSAESPAGRIEGEQYIRMEAGEEAETVMEEVGEKMSDPDFWAEPPSEQDGPAPTHPELRREITPPPPAPEDREGEDEKETDAAEPTQDAEEDAPPLETLLEEWADQTKLSFVVEELHRSQGVPDEAIFSPRKEPLHQALDRLKLIGYGWEHSPGVVRIRPLDWAVQRSYEVPESLLAAYRKTLNQKGWLNLDDMASLFAALTDEQISFRVSKDEALKYPLFNLMLMKCEIRQFIRFYGHLTPHEMEALRHPDGLPTAALREDLHAQVAGLFEELRQGTPLGEGKIRLRTRIRQPRLIAPDPPAPPAPPAPVTPDTSDFTFEIETGDTDPPLTARGSFSIVNKARIKGLRGVGQEAEGQTKP